MLRTKTSRKIVVTITIFSITITFFGILLYREGYLFHYVIFLLSVLAGTFILSAIFDWIDRGDET